MHIVQCVYTKHVYTIDVVFSHWTKSYFNMCVIDVNERTIANSFLSLSLIVDCLNWSFYYYLKCYQYHNNKPEPTLMDSLPLMLRNTLLWAFVLRSVYWIYLDHWSHLDSSTLQHIAAIKSQLLNKVLFLWTNQYRLTKVEFHLENTRN